jgi:hypothetical protein
VWNDGRAEVAVYKVTRIVDRQTIRSSARVLINKELADPNTKTRSTGKDPAGMREVFKQHVLEEMPPDAGGQRYSTVCYVGTRDLKSLKVEVGEFDDTGTTFKRFVNHAGTLEWHQFSHLPGGGHKTGRYNPSTDFAFQNALGVVLRGNPSEPPRDLQITMLTDQTAAALTPAEPEPAMIVYVGWEHLDWRDTQIGEHNLRVRLLNQDKPIPAFDYWFAAEPGPPLQNVMLRYETRGTRFDLETIDRVMLPDSPAGGPSSRF